MKAEIITYETKNLTNTKRSILSKKLFGYKDRTKDSKYVYQRKGILAPLTHIVITKKTFIVGIGQANQVKSFIKEFGAEVKGWKIDINYGKLKKRYG